MKPNQQAVLDACALADEGKFDEAAVLLVSVMHPTEWNPATDPVVAATYVEAFNTPTVLAWINAPETISMIAELQLKYPRVKP